MRVLQLANHMVHRTCAACSPVAHQAEHCAQMPAAGPRGRMHKMRAPAPKHTLAPEISGRLAAETYSTIRTHPAHTHTQPQLMPSVTDRPLHWLTAS